MILGLGACLFRLFSGLILGSWLIARIDRTLLQRGYESADTGKTFTKGSGPYTNMLYSKQKSSGMEQALLLPKAGVIECAHSVLEA